MASTLVDLVKINIASTGTGPLTLGAAASGYRGAEALINGRVYSYSIQQGSKWEVGRGTYLSGSNQLIRSVLFSSNGGTPISLSQNAQVAFTALAEDLTLKTGVLQPGAWTIFTGLPRLKLTGAGTVSIDTNTAEDGSGTTALAVFTASPADSTTIAFPFFGTDAVAVRATYTGTALAEII